MKFHWKVLIWMLAGALFGLVLQAWAESRAWLGAEVEAAPDGVAVTRVTGGGPAARAGLAAGDVLSAVILHRGSKRASAAEETLPLAAPEDLAGVLARAENGDVLWFVQPGEEPELLTVGLDPDSSLARWIAPFDFGADIFMALLRMLIVPIILTSIISGVAGVGDVRELGRLGGKTFTYYVTTSLLAILVGQLFVSLTRPGDGAELGLAQLSRGGLLPEASFIDVLKRMVPSNVVAAMADNGEMLSVIFFALLFGYFVTRTDEPHRERVTGIFDSLFHVALRMARGILVLLPLGVFCLLVRVVAQTGFAVFRPLLFYMLVVVVALAVHACVTLPLIVRVVGRISPWLWFKAMAPALITAFSTSSSSLTLPVTLETVEKRGRVSNRISSFTLPLGATVNMDGTALYECIGVIFLAQYYASTGDFDLTLPKQGLVVMMALMASIGAAGIPSAGLVMMLAILAALGLPLEGAALLLAVDRPLDMLRTVVNVWSDSCGAAVIARSEGEDGPLAPSLAD